MFRSTMQSSAGVMLLFALAACDSTGTGRIGTTVSFSTQAPAAGTASRASYDITVTSGANTLVITKAQLVLRQLELKVSAATTCAAGTEADSCEEMELGPMIVDLPVTAGVTTPVSATVPAGSYSEIEFDIRRPQTDPADLALVAAHPEFNNVSIRVQGTYNGTPFVFTSELDQEVQMEFNPPAVVAEGTNNVTIQVNIRSWFTKADGSLIDPATANPGQVNASIVAEKIKTSLRAVDDDDKSGS